MSRAASILMTTDEIRAELGWSDDMVRRLLRIPDAPASIRGKHKCDRYNRDRVLAVAQTPAGRDAKRDWDETLRSPTPNPGWTPRLTDIGCLLGISAAAVGKMLELLGFRTGGNATDSAVRAGCGVRRWDGFAMHCDWHLERVVATIRSAAEVPGTPGVATAFVAAIAKQQVRDWAVARRRKQQELEAIGRQEEEAMIFGLEVELRRLRSTNPGMSLFTAVEYITSHPVHRIALYRSCHADDESIGTAKDLALLARRAQAEGFSSECITQRDIITK